MNSQYTIYYWKIRGLGNPVATLLEYLKAPYTYHQYTDRDTWSTDKQKLLESGFLNPNLPYLHDKKNDKKLSETFAVLLYLAGQHRKEMVPQSMEEMTHALMVQGVIADYNKAITTSAYSSKTVEEMIEALKGSMASNATKTNFFKVTLEKNKFVQGEQVTFLDFYLADLIEKFVTMQEELKQEFVDEATLKVFKDYVCRFTSLDGIKEYREGEKFMKRPFNFAPFAAWA